MASKKQARREAVPPRGEVWPVTVYLLKGVKSPNDALHKKSKGAAIHEVAGIGALVLKEATAVEPKWATRLAEVAPAAAALRQQSPGAVLFVWASARLFALTFGYGRSLLAPEAIVHDFGIRVVLNSVDPAHLRSVDSRTLEVSPQMLRKQFVDERPFAAFALDRLHDLLKGVTGRVRNEVTEFDRGSVTGTDSLQCRVRVDHIADLASHCATFLARYKKKDYKTNFAFIDDVRFIRDPVLAKKLDAALLAVAKSAVDDFGFGPPRILAGEELSRLQCSWSKRRSTAELNADVIRKRLSAVVKKVRRPETFIKRLKTDRIELLDATGQVIEGWSLYRCLVVELAGTKAHILTTGDWYELSKSFVAEVTRRFDQIVSDSAAAPIVPLPSQKPTHSTEAKYNAYAAKSLGCDLLDKTSLTTGLGASGVEPCDLVDARRGAFVHVKVGRSSAHLSHLFNQGLVATITLLDESGARDNLRKLLSPKGRRSKVLKEPFQASKLTTVFAVIDKAPPSGTWRLPFFSMLVASSVHDRIRQRGVAVQVVRVEAA